MNFSMDNQTIICYEKNSIGKYIGVILFDGDSFNKMGEYLIPRVDYSMDYEPYQNEHFSGKEYNKQIDSFQKGKYLLVQMYSSKQ